MSVDEARFRRLEVLFHAALALPPERRSAYVEAECADDAALRRSMSRRIRAGQRKALSSAPPRRRGRAARHALRAGRRPEALEWAAAAFQERNRLVHDMVADPVFDVVRDEPSFQRGVRELGLPEPVR